MAINTLAYEYVLRRHIYEGHAPNIVEKAKEFARGVARDNFTEKIATDVEIEETEHTDGIHFRIDGVLMSRKDMLQFVNFFLKMHKLATDPRNVPQVCIDTRELLDDLENIVAILKTTTHVPPDGRQENTNGDNVPGGLGSDDQLSGGS